MKCDLTVLYIADVGFCSVVAIHGLCGLSRKTWEVQDKPGHLWLHEVFSSESSDAARAILYGYDPNESTRSCYTLHGIYEMAQELLLMLLELRAGEVKVNSQSNCEQKSKQWILKQDKRRRTHDVQFSG